MLYFPFLCVPWEREFWYCCAFVFSLQVNCLRRLTSVGQENPIWNPVTEHWGKTAWLWMKMRLFFVRAIAHLLVHFSFLMLSLFAFIFPKYTSFITQLCVTVQLHDALLLASFFFPLLFLDNYFQLGSLCWSFLQHSFTNNSTETAKGHWDVTRVKAGKR